MRGILSKFHLHTYIHINFTCDFPINFTCDTLGAGGDKKRLRQPRKKKKPSNTFIVHVLKESYCIFYLISKQYIHINFTCDFPINFTCDTLGAGGDKKRLRQPRKKKKPSNTFIVHVLKESYCIFYLISKQYIHINFICDFVMNFICDFL